MASWNPWHGCHKYSAGCLNCYVYRIDSKYERDSSVVTKNKTFYAPIEKNKKGEYKIKSGSIIYTCFSSDFFVSDADEWRVEAWEMIKERSDCEFMFLTKRIERFYDVIPPDWGDGYPNVYIVCTVENQAMADIRLPIYMKAPIKKKAIACAPLLSKIEIEKYLDETIIEVDADGESGTNARVCDYNWILNIREQCINKGIKFTFRQTGSKLLKDGKVYQIPRKQHFSQARKANLNYDPKNQKTLFSIH